MRIGTRLTLWYAALLFVSLVIMAGVMYYEWTEQREMLRQQATPPESVWEEVGEVLLYAGLPTAGLLLVGGWLILRRTLAPISTLTRAAERIHAGNLTERLPLTNSGDELDRLTRVFNEMTGRLHDSFESIREFTLHASHELRTPLTVMHAELETALRDESLSTPARERAASMLDEVQRLTHIVDGLMFLTKADAGMLKFAREPVPLDEVLRDAYADAQILGEARKLKVKLNQCCSICVEGDRHRLRQLLLILTDNAIKYNHDAGTVTLDLHSNNGSAVLTIANSGAGIPSELSGRVFDRFFRGDPSHNQAIEGSGLGLSIAQGIVEAHGGRISIASEPQRLTTVKVELPAATGH